MRVEYTCPKMFVWRFHYRTGCDDSTCLARFGSFNQDVSWRRVREVRFAAPTIQSRCRTTFNPSTIACLHSSAVPCSKGWFFHYCRIYCLLYLNSTYCCTVRSCYVDCKTPARTDSGDSRSSSSSSSTPCSAWLAVSLFWTLEKFHGYT